MGFRFWSEAAPYRLRQEKTPDKNAVFRLECRHRASSRLAGKRLAGKACNGNPRGMWEPLWTADLTTGKGLKTHCNLGKLFRKAFEQLALETLSEMQFKALTGGYDAEKQELLTLSGKLGQELSDGKDTMLDAVRFMAVVGRYTGVYRGDCGT